MRPALLPFLSLSALLVACSGGSSTSHATAPPVKAAPPPPEPEVVATPAPASKPDPEPIAQAEPPPPAPAVAPDTRPANTFAARLLRSALKKPGNVMLSGASLRQALGVVYLGAGGDTAREMATALDLDRDPKKAAESAARETKALDAVRGKAELVVANRLWTDKAQPLAPDFVSAAAAASASAEPVDFFHAPDDARRAINAWVAERTQDKIRDLLPAGSVDKRSRLVVTNAVYFKGGWVFPFPPAATKNEPFHVDAKRTVNAPLMHVTDTFRFGERAGAKVLELRYTDTQLAMVVVLPDALDKTQQALSADAISEWTNELTTKRVNVTLPRFSFRSGGSMNAALRELGMQKAFTDKADFKGISPNAQLAISEVAHQTFIAVDEKGTEAAAATGVVMRTTSLDTSPVAEFKADRPFLFFLRDTKSGLVLFAGRVSEPSAKGM